MARQKISSGSSYEAIAGYSRAIVDGTTAHVSGTTGFDYSTMTIADDAAEQTRQCFRNIEGVLKQAGLGLNDIIRVRYYLTEASLFATLAPVFGEYLGQARPAATAVVCGLVDPRMKIEIEVTAKGDA